MSNILGRLTEESWILLKLKREGSRKDCNTPVVNGCKDLERQCVCPAARLSTVARHFRHISCLNLQNSLVAKQNGPVGCLKAVAYLSRRESSACSFGSESEQK